jgi:fucose permease
MITAAALMQRIPARRMILFALLLAVVTAAIAIAAAFHGVAVHGHLAMLYDGPHSKMLYD